MKPLDLVSLIIVGFTLYLGYCFFDLKFVRPLDVTVGNIVIEADSSGKQRYISTFREIYVSPGDSIHVEYNTNRIKTGQLIIDRVFTDPQEKEYVLSTTKKEISQELLGKTSVISSYKIPRHIDYGCGAKLFSRSIFITSYNALSEAFPQTISGPKIPVCVIKEADLEKYIFHENPRF